MSKRVIVICLVTMFGVLGITEISWAREGIVEDVQRKAGKISESKKQKNQTHLGIDSELQKEITQKEDVFLYNKELDLYLNSIIKQSRRLVRQKKFNEAEILLVTEQNKLEEKGLLIYPQIEEGQLQLPSPLMMTLSWVHEKAGGVPTEMIQYYRNIINEYSNSKHSYTASVQYILKSKVDDNCEELLKIRFNVNEHEHIYSQLLQLYASGKVKVSRNNIIKVLNKKFGSQQPSKATRDMYNKLTHAEKNILEPLLWEYCQQWDEFNNSNRNEIAQMHRNYVKHGIKARQIYGSVMDRYDSGDYYEKAKCRYLQEVNDYIVFRLASVKSTKNKTYQKTLHTFKKDVREKYGVIPRDISVDMKALESIDETYQEILYTLKKDVREKFDVIPQDISIEMTTLESIAYIGQNNIAKALQILSNIDDNKLLEVFERYYPSISYENKVKVEGFVWGHYKQWIEFNKNNRLELIEQAFKLGKYVTVIEMAKDIQGRYNEFDHIKCPYEIKSLIQVEEYENANQIIVDTLTEGKSCKKLFNIIQSDIIRLIQDNNIKSANKILDEMITHSSSSDQSVRMLLLAGYCKQISEQQDSALLIQIAKKHPHTLYAMQANLIMDRYESLYEMSQNNSPYTSALLFRMGCKCMEEGEVEKMVDNFTKLIIEYPSGNRLNQAWYCVGYYYMLCGEYSRAGEILKHVTKRYGGSEYAEKATILVKRISLFTDAGM